MQFARLRPLAVISMLLIALTLSGCATTTGGGGTEVACTALESLSWSRADTDQTIRGVKRHNAKWRAICG